MDRLNNGGFMASEHVKRWEKIPFDGKLGYCRPDSLDRFVVCLTKEKAVEYAKQHSIPQTFITRIGSRFWKGWGFMDQFGQFLLSDHTRQHG